ncbi:hypothetical protein DN820_17595 [Stutzerimonas nosocomialis]|uniref:Uncharacterized protein n=1 Tax=Stutzerimonas nosocomialis TaxID=1056496 RepID=A0A5R9QBU8_9GAMM|nr:hypothetical protein [Stutzerimonas nosocomialis]TLX62145.1 hypothetical protein DN820_17595 [Stutzerimonas nosocomialis]
MKYLSLFLVVLPIGYLLLERFLVFIEPYMDYLNENPLWGLLAWPLVVLALGDWGWKRKLVAAYHRRNGSA